VQVIHLRTIKNEEVTVSALRDPQAR
jgi:hypothetical protein